MKSHNIISLVAAGTLCLGASIGSALAQGTAKSDHPVWGNTNYGGWDVRTAPTGGCPAMNLSVVRSGDGLTGVVSTGEWASVSRLTGSVDEKARTFSLSAKPVEPNGPTGTIEGSMNQVQRYLDVKLKGFGCEGERSLRIPYSQPDQRID